MTQNSFGNVRNAGKTKHTFLVIERLVNKVLSKRANKRQTVGRGGKRGKE